MKTTTTTTTVASLLLMASSSAPILVLGGGRDHCLRHHRQLKQQTTTSSESSSHQQKNIRSAGEPSASKAKSEEKSAISLSPGVRIFQFQQPSLGDITLPAGTNDGETSAPAPAGSVIMLDHPIYHKEDRETIIGKMAGSCMRVDEQWHCNATYEFDGHRRDDGKSAAADGQHHSLTVAGPMALFHDDTGTMTGDVWNSVLSGTGEYVGAMGEGHYVPQTDDKEWINVSLYFL